MNSRTGVTWLEVLWLVIVGGMAGAVIALYVKAMTLR